MDKLTQHLFRENSSKMLGVLSKKFGANYLELIADAVQDTFEAALVRWRFSGVPDKPQAWLMAVAKNKLINALQREKKWCNTPIEELITDGEQYSEYNDQQILDSQLRLLLLCCRPELTPKQQIAITLYILCGFGTSEIANALLMQEEAVKKTLTRIKKQLKTSAIPTPNFSFMLEEEIHKPIHTILYLMFNEGYKSTKDKKGINIDLCYEAIRLTKMLLSESNKDFEIRSLLALMFFTVARFPARISQEGDWITFEEQDRSLWDKSYIEEGFYYLKDLSLNKELNVYYIEALIAAVHCVVAEFKDTDWSSIAYLYKQLEVLKPDNFVVQFNRIIAESFVGNPKNSLRELQQLEHKEIKGYKFIYYAGQGFLYSKIGDREQELLMYKESLHFVHSKMDKKWMLKKIANKRPEAFSRTDEVINE